MLKNFFKTAWRNLLRSKGYSALNILGLATGMAVTLLIGLWVAHEYSYDTYLPDSGQLYRVQRNYNSNGDTLTFTSTSFKLADVLRTQPEIEYVAEGDYWSPHGLMVGEKKLYQTGSIVASDFLKMFQYPMIKGNLSTALKDPYSIVLTASVARSLFGDKDPMGQTVRLDNANDLKVTGILKDLPSNSNFAFKYLLPMDFAEATNAHYRNARKANSYDWNNFNIYVKLRPGVTLAQVAPKIRNIEHTETNSNNAMNSFVLLQPLRNWHLYGNYINGKEHEGFLVYVRLFSIVGLLVLIIACINFINLTTARSEKRAREVGVRKAIGSSRKELIGQFLLESLLLSLIAFGVSLLLVRIALPAFNALTGADMTIPSGGLFWLLLLGCVIVTAVAAGSRPAFYLSSFHPVKVLKGTIKAGRSASVSRKILVVLQFSCSVALIISTIVVYQQIQYVRQRPLGYNIDRILSTDLNNDLRQHYAALREDLLREGLITSIASTSNSATQVWSHSDVSQWPGKRAGETIEMGTVYTSGDYFKTLGMQLKEGRLFESNSDTACVIFNENAIRQMRIKDPLNQIVEWQGMNLRIIGVVKNALMSNPFSPAEPTGFLYTPYPQNILVYKLSSKAGTEKTLARLTTLFNKYNPAYPYTYQFADLDYARKFSTELLVGKLAAIFAGLAIFISCLGLFGMAAYIAEQRTREIGIRKVLGASVSRLCVMMSKDFVLLVAISCVIASPVALYFLKNWLQKYDYHIGIGPGAFIAAAGAALLITLATISFQAIKAAMANPVKSLKSE